MSAQAGILYTDGRPVPREVVGLLTDVNNRRGPDGSGLYVADGIAMLSFALHFDALARREMQPVRGADGSVLTWDGRLDNREDFLVCLAPELKEDRSDARLMAHAISKWHIHGLTRAIGDWSLALWRPGSREILLARDYAGNRPLFYSQQPDYVAWSTCLEPLVRLCGVADQLDDAYMARLLLRKPLTPYTKYRGLLHVPAGTALRLSPGLAPQATAFASFNPREIRYRQMSEYAEHYRHLFTEAVRVRLRATGPVWSELSGGYDSSSITSVAHGLVQSSAVETPRLQPVSYVCPDSPESDEATYIHDVEMHCGFESFKLPVTNQSVLDSISSLVSTESSHCIPPEIAAPMLAAGSHVLLSGELGDVISASATVEDALLDDLRTGRLRRSLEDGVAYGRFVRQPLWRVWLASLKHALPERSRGSHSESVAAHDVADLCLTSTFLERALEHVPRSRADLSQVPRSKRGLLRSVQDFIDINALSASDLPFALRLTYPFAYRPLVDFVLAAPPTVLWRPEHKRAFICTALRDVLPPAIMARHDKGFAAPAVSRALVATTMDSLSTLHTWRLVVHGYVDPVPLANLFRAFLDGSRSISATVGHFLMAEAQLRTMTSPTGDTMPLSTFRESSDEPLADGCMAGLAASHTSQHS